MAKLLVCPLLCLCQAKDYQSSETNKSAEKDIFKKYLCETYQKAFPKPKVKQTKRQKTAAAATRKAVGEMPNSNITDTEATKYLPPDCHIKKDAFNGRWRASWKGISSFLGGVSRSWSSRGSEGERASLSETLSNLVDKVP